MYTRMTSLNVTCSRDSNFVEYPTILVITNRIWRLSNLHEALTNKMIIIIAFMIMHKLIHFWCTEYLEFYLGNFISISHRIFQNITSTKLEFTWGSKVLNQPRYYLHVFRQFEKREKWVVWLVWTIVSIVSTRPSLMEYKI